MRYFYLLRRTPIGLDNQLPIGTCFVTASGYRGMKHALSDNAAAYRVAGTGEDQWYNETVPTMASLKLGHVLTRLHGLAVTNQPLSDMRGQYIVNWGRYQHPRDVYVLEPYNTCMFHGNITVCASRIGPLLADKSRAHLFSINGNGHARVACYTNLLLHGHYHLLALEDTPTCTRCIRIAEGE